MDSEELKGPRTPDDPSTDSGEVENVIEATTTINEETTLNESKEKENESKSDGIDDGELKESEISDGEIIDEISATVKEATTEVILKESIASDEGEITDNEEKPEDLKSKKEQKQKKKEKDKKLKEKKEKRHKKEKSKHHNRSRSRSPSRRRKRSRTPPRKSPLRHRERNVQKSKRRLKAAQHSKKKKNQQKMVGNPMIMLNKCFNLIQFGEHQASQIGDDEMRKYIKELITLGKYVDKLSQKRNILKTEMENMKNNEMKLIQKIHSELPRHMQNVLHFDAHTVHIAHDRNPLPMMMGPPPPFGMPGFMGKFPPPGMNAPPPGFPVGGQVPSYPPPPSGVLHTSATGAPPGLASMNAPPPFPGPPMPPSVAPTGSNVKSSLDVGKFGSPKPQEEKAAPTPPVFNPIAFSNPPPSLMGSGKSEEKLQEGSNQLHGVAFRPPGEAPNPPVNLTNFLTSAVKAHVSQNSQSVHISPFSAPPPTKPPSLMSLQTREPINIIRGGIITSRIRKRPNNEEE